MENKTNDLSIAQENKFERESKKSVKKMKVQNED